MPEQETSVEEKPKEEGVETPSEPLTGMDEFFDVPESKPEGEKSEDAKPEAKAEEKVEEEDKPKQEEVKEEKKEEAKSEDKTEETESKEEEKPPGTDWDSDDNPWRKKAEDATTKEKSSRDWATQINQKLTDLEKQNTITQKKVDGTYDPEKDDQPAQTTEQISQSAELQGRLKSSQVMAYEKYGKDVSEQILDDFDKEYGSNQQVQYRVLTADAPLVEAIKVMKEHKFYEKYGSDTDKIEATIRESVNKEWEGKINAEVDKKIAERLSKKENAVQGLSEVRSSTADTKNESQVDSFESIFS